MRVAGSPASSQKHAAASPKPLMRDASASTNLRPPRRRGGERVGLLLGPGDQPKQQSVAWPRLGLATAARRLNRSRLCGGLFGSRPVMHGSLPGPLYKCFQLPSAWLTPSASPSSIRRSMSTRIVSPRCRGFARSAFVSGSCSRPAQALVRCPAARRSSSMFPVDRLRRRTFCAPDTLRTVSGPCSDQRRARVDPFACGQVLTRWWLSSAAWISWMTGPGGMPSSSRNTVRARSYTWSASATLPRAASACMSRL